MSLSVNSVEDDQSPLLSSYNPSEVSRGPSPRQLLPVLDRRVSDGRQRQPVNYNSISSNSYGSHDSETSAVVSRYKYYTKLAPHSDSSFTMPDHVVPGLFIITEIVKIQGSQSSIITIFSLWNTMMGTSLLSMPWAINQAGFTCGILLLLAMAALMLYTSYRILHSVKCLNSSNEVIEFSDVCREYLGRWAEVIAFVSSLLTLLGGMIVYWILISNFLYNIVTFIYHQSQGEDISTSGSTDPICPSRSPQPNPNHTSPNISMVTGDHSHDATFSRWWDEQKTVPIMLIAVVFPLINFKSPTFFTKFNALGTISVTYLVCFAMKNAISWGVHLDFHNTSSPVYVHEYKNSFPALTGVAALAFFVQNCVLSITRAQKYPQYIVRDLIIAYVLVALTYIYMGVIVYVSFGLDKDCLEDNFLNNLKDTNVMAFVARIGLFFQMICVFPLLVFIFRLQFMNSLFGSIWPSLTHVLLLNSALIGVCIIFAVFLPHIGKIIGFVGAFCGFSYAIALPCLVFMKIRHQAGTLTLPIIIFHSFLILIGLGNFIGQFLLLG
ncbi:neutral amino acid transporter 9-like isoform X2 [Ruditapes philippinarum]|uniref:neutral amino acid transporter 9-like isoform X2 n=1 Tax=Ruditapes philippinarum TaxID=129788 RepID=UPI00295C17C0|nr:neutral amino acid transporter 9-like isoform X2 [Ruditapes philippinarum]